MSVISTKTRGFDQFRSHWNALNVVHTQRPSDRRVKLPGAKSGKTCGSVASYRSGSRRFGKIQNISS